MVSLDMFEWSRGESRISTEWGVATAGLEGGGGGIGIGVYNSQYDFITVLLYIFNSPGEGGGVKIYNIAILYPTGAAPVVSPVCVQ